MSNQVIAVLSVFGTAVYIIGAGIWSATKTGRSVMYHFGGLFALLWPVAIVVGVMLVPFRAGQRYQRKRERAKSMPRAEVVR